MTSLIPQVIVTLSPEGELQIEQAINGVRRLVPLTQANAGKTLARALLAQKKRIEASGVAAPKTKRQASQPDWTVIAKHPQVEIRQMLPGRGLELTNQTIRGKSLEDLGL